MNNFHYPYHETLNLEKTYEILVELINLKNIDEVYTGNVWSYRDKKFGLYSSEYDTHRDKYHIEKSRFCYNNLYQNASSSYLLREDLSKYIDANRISNSLKIKNREDNVKLMQNLLITGGQYTIPFHLDPYDTLILCLKGKRLIHLISNFRDLLSDSDLKLTSGSYIPSELENYAKTIKIQLNQGEGILIQRNIPHAVETSDIDKFTAAYTACIQENGHTIQTKVTISNTKNIYLKQARLAEI